MPKFNIRFMLTVQGVEGEDEEEGIVVMMPEGRHEGFDCAVCEEADKRARAAAGEEVQGSN